MDILAGLVFGGLFQFAVYKTTGYHVGMLFGAPRGRFFG